MLDSLNVRNLRLECAVHFGSVKMATRSSTVEPTGQRGHHQTERQQSIQGEASHIHSRECCNKSGRYLHINTCEGLNSVKCMTGVCAHGWVPRIARIRA